MRTSPAGIALIKRWESLRLRAYKCPRGIWTIGYGHTGDVKPGDVITSHQAEAILDVDLDKFERGVLQLTQGVQLAQHEFDALVAFAFNVGLGTVKPKPTGLAGSALLRKLRQGDRAGAADEFPKWRKAGGKVLAGLIARRADERALFLGR